MSIIKQLKEIQISSYETLVQWNELATLLEKRYYFISNTNAEEVDDKLNHFNNALITIKSDIFLKMIKKDLQDEVDSAIELWNVIRESILTAEELFSQIEDSEYANQIIESGLGNIIKNQGPANYDTQSANIFYFYHSMIRNKLDFLLKYEYTGEFYKNKLTDIQIEIDKVVRLITNVISFTTVLLSLIVIVSSAYSFKIKNREQRRNQERLSATLNAIGDAMIVTDRQGIIQRMNSRAEQITVSVGTAAGKIITKVFNPHSAITGETEEEQLIKLIRDNNSLELHENSVLETLEGKKHISFSLFPIRDKTDDSNGSVLIFRDISVRKEQERNLENLRLYLKSIIQSMPSLLVVFSNDKKIKICNKDIEEETGGLPFSRFLENYGIDEKVIDKCLSEDYLYVEKKRPVNEEGEIRYKEITLFPLHSKKEQDIILQISDVTEQTKMEEMIIESEKMMSVGGLAAGMAHEINNPLAGMMQTINVIKNRILDNMDIPKSRKYAEEMGLDLEKMKLFLEKREIPRMFESISESGHRVSEIIKNMLDFARKEAEGYSSHSINEILEQTLVLAKTDYNLKKQYDFKNVNIIKDYSENLPIVPCDRPRIQQVLLNLFQNAAQAMHQAGIDDMTLIIKTHFDNVTGNIIITIKDNGPGIDDEISKKIFEPFFTTKPAGVGTGLGLSVSYFIITEKHKGKLYVRSQLSEGAEFTIELPVL